MKIKEYKFELKCVDFDNEKWNDTITIRGTNLYQATKEMWNTLSEHLALGDLAQVSIMNLNELRKI